MEINSVKQPGGQQATAANQGPTGRGEETMQVRNSLEDNERVQVPAAEKSDKPATDEERQKWMQEGTKSILADIYAVSDSKFTIFKDASGQYITRITSLRDGRVTYIPEPEVLEYMIARTRPVPGHVQLKA